MLPFPNPALGRGPTCRRREIYTRGGSEKKNEIALTGGGESGLTEVQGGRSCESVHLNTRGSGAEVLG